MKSDLIQKILDATNDGLDIITRYYPQARTGKNFKIRHDEKTASASLIRHESGTYLVTDFGDDSQPRNAIAVMAKEEGLTFKDAMIALGSQLGLLDQRSVLSPTIEKVSPTEADYEFDESGFYFEFNTELSKSELEYLGPLVTQEVCSRYRLFSVRFYAKRKENEIVRMSSTEHYPIFAFVNKTKEGKEWKKVLQPKAQDKKFRFFYVGGRPKDFVFGLDYFERKYNDLQNPMDDESDDEPKETKIERVVIASGDRDALNLAGAGELVIWLNSETATFSVGLYSKLRSKAKRIVNVPDIDETGVIQGRELALEYLDIFTAWLPKSLSHSKDFRGNSKKDFLDFCSVHQHNDYKLRQEVRLLLDNAKTAQFWDVKFGNKDVNYVFNNVNAYYFLAVSGYYRMISPVNDQEFIFIRRVGHLVQRVNYTLVKDYVNSFLERKQSALGERIIPNALRNMIYNSNKMAESSLINLPTSQPEFQSYGSDWQLFFFRDQIWRITPKGIVEESMSKVKICTWEEDLIDEKIRKTYGYSLDRRKIFIDQDYFKIYKDKDENLTIKLETKECDFLNYLINTSRVHWRKEDYALAGKTDEEKAQYWEDNKFELNGYGLDEDEIHEHHLHLINKIYIYGFLLHRYKDPAKAWAVYLMDNEVVEDDESHGRTGKSIYAKSIQVLNSQKYIGARSNKLFDNSFIYDGVSEHTHNMLFDDASRYFKIDDLYTVITGDLNINPKNNQQFTIPYSKSPKVVVSTNFSLRDTSPSTIERLLIGAFGNRYHGANEDMEKYGPMDDFGYRLFDDWDTEQWNRYVNFAAQALKFYLSCEEKIDAPDSNVMKRNSLAIMGVTFQNWADNYLIDYLNYSLETNEELPKTEALKDLQNKESSTNRLSSNGFYKKVKAWCNYNDVILNPKEKVTTKDGRITRRVDNKTTEFYYLLKTNADDEDGVADALPDPIDDFEL